MRAALTLSAAVAALVLFSADVRAEDGARGTYAVHFEEVVDNCEQTGIGLSRAEVVLGGRGRRLTVEMPIVPTMRGSLGKSGKLRAKAKKGKTGIRGVEGAFSISGRIKDKTLQVVLIAEYFRGGKPLCTQSWTGKGKRR